MAVATKLSRHGNPCFFRCDCWTHSTTVQSDVDKKKNNTLDSITYTQYTHTHSIKLQYIHAAAVVVAFATSAIVDALPVFWL